MRTLRIKVPILVEGSLYIEMDVADDDPGTVRDAVAQIEGEVIDNAGLAVAEWAVSIENHGLAFEGKFRIANHEEVVGG